MSDNSVRMEIQIRFGDLDTLRHVNNAVYLTYFELGRIQLMKKILGDFTLDDIDFVLARIEIDFKKSVTISDRILLETELSGVGRTSMTFSHRLINATTGEIHCTGKVIAVFVDGNQKPTAVPVEIRAFASNGSEGVSQPSQ